VPVSVALAMLAGPQPDISIHQSSAQLAAAAELEERKLSKARQVGQAGASHSALPCVRNVFWHQLRVRSRLRVTSDGKRSYDVQVEHVSRAKATWLTIHSRCLPSLWDRYGGQAQASNPCHLGLPPP